MSLQHSPTVLMMIITEKGSDTEAGLKRLMMITDHINFWWEFVAKVGAPIFVATLVACLGEKIAKIEKKIITSSMKT